MKFSTIENIPEKERKYWNIGNDSDVKLNQATAAETWAEYLEMHRQGNWLQALKAVNRLIGYDQNQIEFWRVKAKLHGLLGHSISCDCAIRNLLEIAPNDLDALRMKAMFLFCHNSDEHALSICETVLGQNPTQADFWALKADILCSRGDLPEADKACRLALSIKPDCIAALRLKKNINATM